MSNALLVKELRERTGAAIMDCKRALAECGDDIDKAADHMRKLGQAKADKKSGRTAAEGLIRILVSADKKQIIILEINCETDFVARDQSFLDFCQAVTTVAFEQKTPDVETLLNQTIQGQTVEEKRRDLIAKLGENIQIRRLQYLQSSKGHFGHYVHNHRIGVIVELEGGDESLAKDLSMHIAANKPLVVNPEDIDAKTKEKEKEIYLSQAATSGKPEAIIQKMVEGRLNKFLEEMSLMGQPFVKDPDVTIRQLTQKANAKVVSFIRLEVGEGIEKAKVDFVSEVMAQVRE